MPLTLRYIARSDVGLVREGNEDSGYAGPYLLVVADGMGGHAAGEVASLATVHRLVEALPPEPGIDPIDWLRRAFATANARIRQLVAENPARSGMGTTLTAMLWTGTAMGLGHIGDSRAYLLRDGALRRLTKDHTVVQELVDAGQLTPEAAREHFARAVVTKVLQGHDPIDPYYGVVEVRPGDRLLLCSDGLTDVVPDAVLESTLGAQPGAETVADTADELMRLALAGGAPDNVTVVLANVVSDEGRRTPPAAAKSDNS